jgi:hypothetical protein
VNNLERRNYLYMIVFDLTEYAKVLLSSRYSGDLPSARKQLKSNMNRLSK